jgi:hypothetical protein
LPFSVIFSFVEWVIELGSYLEVAAHEDGKGDSVDEHEEDDIGEGKRALCLEWKTDGKLYSGIHAHMNKKWRKGFFIICFRISES